METITPKVKQPIDSPSQESPVLNADILKTSGLSPLKVSQFIDFPADSTPGNVGVAISGGSSRSMVAGMGQLRGLQALSNAKGNLLGQTKAISAVSGGSWLTVPFMYLDVCSDDEFLGVYQDPSLYTVDNLQQLDEKNIGARCTKEFSTGALAAQAVLLVTTGLPADLVWQTLIGIHILKPYQLYSQEKGIPDSFFSYDKNYLANNILKSNPPLRKEVVNLIATGEKRIRRPYYICNASMFVSVPGQVRLSLVPVQSTSFFTGIISTPGKALDANHQLVGGGGVSSFAFSSNPVEIDSEKATINQSRQFSLMDATGVSSSFFAEYLERRSVVWRANPKQFFAEIKDQLTTDRWQHILDNIPVGHGIVLRGLLEKLQDLKHTEAEIGNEQLLKKNIDPAIFNHAFAKLAAIVPQYQYWPVNSAPKNNILPTAFADGGNLENTGIAALLTYQDIDNIISFINSSTPLAAAEHGIIDASGQEVPDTRIMVDSQVPPLFGYQPYDKNHGYKLYSGDQYPVHLLPKNNQIFPSEAFQELLRGLWQVSSNKDNPGSNQYAANFLQSLTTVDNTWLGVKGGKKIKILWQYTNFINDWYEQLSPNIQSQIFNNDPTHYYNFPHYNTFDTELTSTQINLLSALTSWSVAKASGEQILSMYDSSPGLC